MNIFYFYSVLLLRISCYDRDMVTYQNYNFCDKVRDRVELQIIIISVFDFSSFVPCPFFAFFENAVLKQCLSLFIVNRFFVKQRLLLFFLYTVFHVHDLYYALHVYYYFCYIIITGGRI